MKKKLLKNMEWSILVVTALLVIIGLFALFSATQDTEHKEFQKQLQWIAISIPFLILVITIDYNIIIRFSALGYLVVIPLLVGVLFTEARSGASSWYKIGENISFQPSELAKTGFIIFFASLLSDIKRAGNIKKFWKGFVLPMAFLAPIVVIVYKGQNHLSATLLIAAVTCVQMFVVGVPLRHFIIAGVAGVLAFLSYKGIDGYLHPVDPAEAAEKENFRAGRMKVWRDPFSDPTGKGWQIIQSLYAIASGSLFGLGFGESRQKYLYLPEPHNDFIFAVVAEETGFFGCVIVILLFAIFVWRGIIIAMKSPDTFGSLIAIGITVLIGLQTIVNVAVVTGTIPVTGMPLPFFSYGGTALVVNLATVGILLNISRTCKQK